MIENYKKVDEIRNPISFSELISFYAWKLAMFMSDKI